MCTLKFVSLGPNGEWFVSFRHKNYWGNASHEFGAWMQQNPFPVRAVSFGPDNTWFVSTDNSQSPCCYLPPDIGKYVYGYNRSGRWVEQVAINSKGDWWVALSDGTTHSRALSGDPNFLKFRKAAVLFAFGPGNETAAIMENGEVLSWGFHAPIHHLPPEVRYFNPKDIRFTQDRICQTFQDGSRIRWLSNNLRWGVCTVDQIYPIRVVISNRGLVWALDNRRLWAFKVSKRRKVPVLIVPYSQVGAELQRKKTTTTNGLSVGIFGWD